LKTKVLYFFTSCFVTLLLVSFSDPYSIKRVSDANYRYEFYTTSKTVKPRDNRVYYWFKGGLIHNTQSGMVGELLNDTFVKMYHSNQLAEQGVFKNGLKIGLWKTWHPNGALETTQKWSNGLQTGKFYLYDENKLLIEKGDFRKGKKHGVWINYLIKDTIIYKAGAVFIKKVKISKAEKANLKELKKTEISNKKALKEEAETKNRTNSNPEKATERSPKKESFFKRILSKKKPKQPADG
jgi:hypothetical protein